MNRIEAAIVGSSLMFEKGVSAYLVNKKQLPLVVYHDGLNRELTEQNGIYTASAAASIPEECTVIIHVLDNLEEDVIRKCEKTILVITQDKKQIIRAKKAVNTRNIKVIVRDYISCKISDRYIRSTLGLPKDSVWIIPDDYKDRKISLLMQYDRKFSLHGISYAKREVMNQTADFILSVEGEKL